MKAVAVSQPHASTRPSVAERPTVEDLFRAYAPYVGSIALRLMGNGPDADDLLQDVFAVASRKLHQVADLEGGRPWLARITVLTARNRLRRRKLFALVGLEQERIDQGLVATSASPEERAIATQLFSILDSLAPRHRTAWTLRHLEQEPLQSVAALCDCSLATAKRWIAAAQAHIEERLAHEPR
jgi:RNA polymerase sigma-70 factor (ECF subfamily)